MGNTPFYNLGYIEPSQDLSKNLDLDELRFRAIDTQLYALYKTFKNGIIEDSTNNYVSWRIETYSNDNKFLKVSVTSGKGHVSFKAAETTSSKDINLPVIPTDVSEVKIWFYAIENSNTPVTKDVDFISSLIKIDDTDNYINIGGVTVNVSANTITVFNTDRQIISLFSSISNLINEHKHIGGSANPAPIDLKYHVKNKLSGENIENLNLDNVTTGKLNPARLPTISHNSLADKGTLSHSQIDSLLNQYLEADETYRLSDLAITNRLQTLIALKQQSGFDYIDSTQLNTIVYVPSIWPNTLSNTSTGTTSNFSDRSLPNALIGATILDSTPWTSGSGISGSVSDSVYTDVRTYSTKRDFNTAKTYNQNNSLGSYENIKIFGTSDDNSDGYFTINTPLNFKALQQPVTNIFDSSSGWYRAVNTTSNYSSNSVSVDTRLYSYKLFDQAVALNEVSNIGIGFSVGLGTTLSQIGQIYMYLVLGSGTDDPLFTNDVKVTFDSGQYYPTTSPDTLFLSSADGTEIGYKIFDDVIDVASIGASFYKTVDLNDLWPSQFRTSVKGIGFYFSSLKGWNPEKSINFYLNTPTSEQVNPSPFNYDELQAARTSTVTNSTASIFAWNESLYAANGKFLIRFDSGLNNTNYNLIQWDIDQPTNTQYSITTRTDISSTLFYDLTNVDTLSDLASGNLDTNSSQGRYLDLLVNINSDTTREFAPKLNQLKISYSTVGTGNTKVYNTKFSNFDTTQTGWETESYYSKNIGFGATYAENSIEKNKMKILSTTSIGNWYYLRGNSAIQTDINNDDTTFEDGVDLLSMSTYKTPIQIFEKSTSLGFNNPKDFQELTDGSRIFCDTLNDRIVKFDLDGNITKLIQGNIRLKQSEKDFVALAGYFNPDVRKIWVAFSQNISSSTPFDSTKIYINFDNNLVRLDDTRIDQNATGLFSLIDGNSATLEITFTNNAVGRALATSISSARSKKIRLDKGAVTNGGYSVNTVGIGTESSEIISYKTQNSIKYFNQLYSSSFAGTFTTSYGLPVTVTSPAILSDFNQDDIVPTENLLGPSDQIDDVSVDIYEGPIHFANIYNPISVHYSNDNIIFAQAFSDAIVSYADDTNLTLNYTIPSQVAEFIDTKLGSVYEISDGLLLIGCPGTVSNNFDGKLIKYRVTGGVTEMKLSFTNLDVVKALPSTNQEQFFVLLDDYLNSGVNTRLKLISSSGNVVSSWGDNYELLHPKGMKLLSNNDLVVSE